MSRADIEHGAKRLCALDSAAMAAKFAAHQDAGKFGQFCGDAVYLVVLLDAFGFDGGLSLTMTNKIKDVELVWTLGAMLAKSAELANAAASGGSTIRNVGLLLALAAALWYWCVRPSRTQGLPAWAPVRQART